MALTHIECLVYRGSEASIENSSFTALNPGKKPGTLVAAGSIAARESLGGQVACRLALEHFVEAVLDSHSDETGQASTQTGEERGIEVLEHAFRRANSSVYQFGHKLAAGGRMATSLIGLVIEDRVIAAGRVGTGSVYLIRGNEFCPFFESRSTGAESGSAFVGENSLVTVELSSIPIEPGDSLFVLPRLLDSDEEAVFRDQVMIGPVRDAAVQEEILHEVFGSVTDIPFFFCARIGPEAIYLTKKI